VDKGNPGPVQVGLLRKDQEQSWVNEVENGQSAGKEQ